MAERAHWWIERWLRLWVSHSDFFSRVRFFATLVIFLYLPARLFVHPCFRWSIYILLCLLMPMSLYIASIYPYAIYLSAHLSTISIHLSIQLSIPLPLLLTIHRSVYHFIYRSVCLSILTASYSTTALLQFFLAHISKVLRLPRQRKATSYEVLRLSCKIILANLRVWCSKMPPLWGNQRPDLLTCLVEMSLIILRLPREMHVYRSPNVPWLPSFLKLLQNPKLYLNFAKM